MYIDFKALNKKIVKNRYPIPRIKEPMDDLHVSNFFSNIDLGSGYHQIRMREEDATMVTLSLLTCPLA